jgi:hypothetical protein
MESLRVRLVNLGRVSFFAERTHFRVGLVGRVGVAVLTVAGLAGGQETGVGLAGLEAWEAPTTGWRVVGDVALDAATPTRLVETRGPGAAVLWNGPDGRADGPKGKAVNLVSRERFGDVEAHVEFLVPKGSNSGVKFEGLYEVQIADTAGRDGPPSASDCGGIYPRAEMLPVYHHIDDGTPPRSNAALPAGRWQSLDVTFRAPRFDASGKKVADARFEKVLLNGRLIHADRAVASPTGHYWRQREFPTGPLLLQGDHGPVAFRNVRVRRLP